MKLLAFVMWGFAAFSLQSQNACDTLRVMFYNLENFCHPSNDSLTNDDDFTPNGSYHYSYKRFGEKAFRLARVIWNANGWALPHLIGVCEVENEKALNELLYSNGLHQAGYRLVHVDSDDPRGMDVTLFYNGWLCKVLEKRPIKVNSVPLSLVTRDILYVKLLFASDDTLHVYVNHWPSKRGGAKASEARRSHVAGILRAHCDSVLSANSQSKLLLMGDFNSEVEEECFQILLGDSSRINSLVRVKMEGNALGSHKFQGRWATIDHFLISKDWMQALCKPKGVIVDLPFLLETDESAAGVRPYRTYRGMQYVGGYSDHLPIFLYLPLP